MRRPGAAVRREELRLRAPSSSRSCCGAPEPSPSVRLGRPRAGCARHPQPPYGECLAGPATSDGRAVVTTIALFNNTWVSGSADNPMGGFPLAVNSEN